MKTILVAEATNIQLDWLVAKCEGFTCPVYEGWEDGEVWLECFNADEGRVYAGFFPSNERFKYTTVWAEGGPIIEREMSKLVRNVGGTFTAQIRHEMDHPLVAHKVPAGWTNAAGPTPLVAAMRCYITSKLGASVEIPEELT